MDSVSAKLNMMPATVTSSALALFWLPLPLVPGPSSFRPRLLELLPAHTMVEEEYDFLGRPLHYIEAIEKPSRIKASNPYSNNKRPSRIDKQEQVEEAREI
nr:hypothetical protein [Tanacetum cinerariifolium]